ncbi:hypothetical protein Fcan01_25278 [Folsomia candida]|uniref:Uncharacterized protein n=1 Tax=Folsomia candida TaxID=158441 RepID=A0A226D6F9_FOLCA|nr:hypothetical protein Fcan01_25278 [Folsomia candida]
MTRILRNVLLTAAYLLNISSKISPWETPDLFENCDITFITKKSIIRGGSSTENVSPFFTQIRKSNPYSALSQFEVNGTSQDSLLRHWSTLPGHSKRISIIFVDLCSDPLKQAIHDITSYSYVHELVLKYLSHVSFIFQHHDSPWNTINFDKHYVHARTLAAPLILVNEKFRDQVYIPCITCDSIAPVSIQMTGGTISMSNIATVWLTLNRNLHQKPVKVIASLPLNLDKCEITMLNVKLDLPPFKYCTMKSLSQAFNFTIVQGNTGAPIYYFVPSYILTSEAVASITQALVIYKVRYNVVQFVYFAPLPTAFEGLISFLSPFGPVVWITLVLSCVAITLIIGCAEDSVAENQGTRKVDNYLIQDFLNVSGILLGQVNGDSFKMFHNRKRIAVPILIVWFFSAHFIIMNNLYMGLIFACLSSISSPILPPTWYSLVDSEIPIITTVPYAASRLIQSALKNRLIPQYINLFQDNPTLVDKFHKLYKKVIYLTGSHKVEILVRYLNSIKISKRISTSKNESLETSKTFALMDDAEHVKTYSKLFQWYGNHLILQAKADTPFAEIYCGLASKNFLLPLFQQRFGELLSFGLEDRWNKLENTYIPIKLHYRVDNGTDKKYFFRAMSNTRGPATVHESDPISLKLVKEIFALCGIIHLISFLVFVKEIGFENMKHYISRISRFV